MGPTFHQGGMKLGKIGIFLSHSLESQITFGCLEETTKRLTLERPDFFYSYKGRRCHFDTCVN